VELFPQRCRGLANSIAYNIALAIFGGLVRRAAQQHLLLPPPLLLLLLHIL
jgi:hypothetical protein